ncbi:MAG TPA: hypothetical protein VJS47_01700 [Rhizomicrobium sp.]|nr:hypothetical protein [Rhizomicrobium sp.]
MKRRNAQCDFTVEATALFARFATKHGLIHAVVDAPVEALWEFPVQAKLSQRIVLGLQNNDELNFGVEDFWSYFFPFADKKSEFEYLINSWVEGTARIVPKPGLIVQSLELQVLEPDGWRVAYDASSLSLRKPLPVVLTNVVANDARK